MPLLLRVTCVVGSWVLCPWVASLGPHSCIVLVDSLFMVHLKIAHERQERYHLWEGNALEQALGHGAVDILEVPINPGSVHWAGIQVDLKCHTFQYCDGYSTSKVAEMADLELLAWFLLPFTHGTTILSPLECSIIPTPCQTDHHSCGIMLLSSLAAEYLGWTPWSQSQAALHRMHWFLVLSEPFCTLVEQ